MGEGGRDCHSGEVSPHGIVKPSITPPPIGDGKYSGSYSLLYCFQGHKEVLLSVLLVMSVRHDL